MAQYDVSEIAIGSDSYVLKDAQAREDTKIIDDDKYLSVALALNAIRQNLWRIEDLQKATAQETGTVTLTNSQGFPFNNSKVSVPLTNRRDNLNYIVVIVSVTGTGNIGEVEVSERLVNGFKIEFTGSAQSAAVTYAVIGGYN